MKVLNWFKIVMLVSTVRLTSPQGLEVILSVENAHETWVDGIKEIYSDPGWVFLGAAVKWKFQTWILWYIFGVVVGIIIANLAIAFLW